MKSRRLLDRADFPKIIWITPNCNGFLHGPWYNLPLGFINILNFSEWKPANTCSSIALPLHIGLHCMYTEQGNCFKVNGGPQLETNIWQVLIGLESKTEASIKQPQTEIKYNMLVAD